MLPLSSLTMRDGNTGVYMIDYVEGVFGQEMVARFVPVTVEEQDRENFSSGDLLDYREYVVSSNRPLKDGGGGGRSMKRWLLCGAFCLLAAVLPSLGMLQLEGAASCLPEGIFYADPNEVVGQPVAEDALDSPWIASYVREGERITFLLFSSQVATAGGGGAAGGFPAGPWRWGAGPLHRRCCSHAPPAENRFLAGIDSLSAGHRLWPYRKGHSPLVAKVSTRDLVFPLGALFLALFAAYIFAWQSLQIPDAFLPTEHFFDLPFYVSQIRWALEGVGLGQPAWGDIPAGERMALGLGLLAAALLAAVIAGVLLIQALRKRVCKTVGKN